MADFTGVAPITMTPDEQDAIAQVDQTPAVAVSPSDPQMAVLPPTTQQTLSHTLTYGMPGIAAGLIDTMGQSLGITKSDTVVNALKNYGPGGMGDYYQRNQQPLRAAGEMVGLALPGLIAMKALKGVQVAREAGYLGKFVQESPLMARLLGTAADLSSLEKNVADTAEATGATQGLFAGRTFAAPAQMAASRAYYAQRVLNVTRETMAWEASYHALYNSSEFLYPTDYTLTDELKWDVAGIGGAAALDYAIGRQVVRKLIQGVAAKLPDISPLADNLRNTTFRPGERGLGLTNMAFANSDAQAIAKNSGSVPLQTSLAQDAISIEGIMKKNIGDMGVDPHPILPRTYLTDNQLKLGVTSLKQNETTFLYATKVANLPDSPLDFSADVKAAIGSARRQYAADMTSAAKIKDPNTSQIAMFAADEKLQKTLDASNEAQFVIENDGRITPYQLRAANWLDDHDFGDIKPVRFKDILPVNNIPTEVQRSALRVDAPVKMQLNDDFTFEGPANLQPDGWSARYAMGSKLIQNWKPVAGQQFILNRNVPWRVTEGMLALVDEHPEVKDAIQFRGGSQVKTPAGKLYPIAGEPLPIKGLAPANLKDDGTVYVGAPNTQHFQIAEKFPATPKNTHSGIGFVTPDGQFLNREQALKWVNSNETQIKPAENMAGQLDALDYREQVPSAIRQNAGVSDFADLKDAIFHVLNEKYKEFSSLMDNTERASRSTGLAATISKRTSIDPSQVIQRLNLPEPIHGQPSPLVQVFAHARLQNAPDLSSIFVRANSAFQQDHPLDLFQAAMKDTFDGLRPANDLPIQGPLFSQQDTKPVFVSMAQAPPLARNDLMLTAHTQAMRDVQLQRLGAIDPQTAPVVAAVMRQTIGTGAAEAARDVKSLFEGVASGRGIVVAQERINEQFPALKAAQLLQQQTDHVVDQIVGKMSATQLTPSIAFMLDAKNKMHLLDFNRIEQAYRYGWDIAEVGEHPESGKMAFTLNADSNMNAKLFKEHFPNEHYDPQETTYMPDMSIAARRNGFTPLLVSQEAAQTASAISEMSRQSAVEVNALRVALGSNAIKIRDFHLPTPDIFDDEAFFVRNSTGKVVATYSGGSLGSNSDRAMEAAQKLISSTKEIHTVASADDVRRENLIWDDNFFDITDYADQLAKSGSAIKGGLAKTEIDTGPQTLKNMARSLNSQFLQAGARARAAIFEPQLNFAKEAGGWVGKSKPFKDSNVFDRYQATLFGRSPVSPTGTLSRIYGSVTDALDNSLSYLNGHFSQISAQTSEGRDAAKSMLNLVRRSTSESEYSQYQKHLGEWSPFTTAQDWAESTFREKTPTGVRENLATLTRVSSTMAIRFLDAGMAVLNLAGFVTNAPSVITSMRQLAGESHEAWIARTAAFGSQIKPGISTFSPSRALMTATHALWSGELNEPMARAAAMGLHEPEYVSLTKVLSDPMTGGKSQLTKWINKASLLADRSEIITRQLSWAMGYKIGKDLHQFDDERNTFIYANNFANDMIGNYNPRNKPAMFQGAIGLPLGAFQTYMFNYYRRIFGYLENKDWTSLAASYAAQASMFGAQSVPGWNLFNKTMFTNYDGSDNLQTRMDRKFSPGVSELILHGSLSNIPKIFGSDGIAFYTRGSVDFTQLPATLADINRAPPLQFLGQTFQMIQKTLDNIFTGGGYSQQQQEEIMANFTTNRALKSLMEIAANAKTDQRGEVIDLGTRDAIHIAAALLGSVPSSTRRMQDAYSAQQQVELSQQDLRSKLNDKTRAMIRSGDFDTSDLQGLVGDYVKSGGNPAYLGQWLRNNLETAMVPKAVTKLDELSKSGKWVEFLNMLSALQQNEPSSPETGKSANSH